MDFEIQTSIWPPDSDVAVVHVRSGLKPDGQPNLVLAEQGTVADCVSAVRLPREYGQPILWVEWEPLLAGPFFGLHFESDAGVVFIGASTLSATIQLEPLELLEYRQPALFWKFERRGRFVLEMGELECHLHSCQGQRLGTVPCDPPYDIEEVSRGVVVTSPVCGSQLLEYPSGDEP